MENEEINIEKPKKKNKKVLIIVLSLLGIIVITAVVFLILFLMKPKYQVTVSAGDGKIIKSLVVNDNTIKSLPEVTPPKGKKLVTWINDKKESVRTGLKLTKNISIEPVYRDENEETVILKFEPGTNLKIKDIVLQKGSKAILPAKIEREEWKLLYWIDKNGYIITNKSIINEDTTLFAYWIKTEKEKVTISFDTDTDEKISDITINKGGTLIFLKPKEIKKGYVFRGWLNKDDKIVTNETKIQKNIKLKANWKEAYTCPENCVPNEDGATCNKDNIVSPTIKEICPSESYLYNGKCITKVGGTSLETGTCYESNDEIAHDGWCMKIVSKITESVCPEGYNKEGDNCKKVDTLECTAN